MTNKSVDPGPKKSDARQAKLARALRANLAKRKAQARVRAQRAAGDKEGEKEA
jgi:hypothetical protein